MLPYNRAKSLCPLPFTSAGDQGVLGYFNRTGRYFVTQGKVIGTILKVHHRFVRRFLFQECG